MRNCDSPHKNKKCPVCGRQLYFSISTGMPTTHRGRCRKLYWANPSRYKRIAQTEAAPTLKHTLT